MKQIILWLVLSASILQLLATDIGSSEESLESSEETIEELETGNDIFEYPWSSEEETDDSREAEKVGGALNSEDISSSEESSQESNESLKGIGNLLKDFWNSKYKRQKFHIQEEKPDLENNDENESEQESSKKEFKDSKVVDNDEIIEEKINKDIQKVKPELKDLSASIKEPNNKEKINSEGKVNTKTEKENMNEKIQKPNSELNDADLPESQQEQHHVIWTYVLWHPRVFEEDNQLLNHYQTFQFLKNMFQTQQDGDQDGVRQGWQDDREQLDLPRVSALQANDEPDMLDNFVDSFNSMNEKIHQVASTPEFKQNIFYFLMGIVGFLMLALFNDNFSKKKEPRTVQDHYFLADTGSTAKLPSYEECTKTDKNILVNMENSEVFNKVDLSLPVLVVDMEDKEEKE